MNLLFANDRPGEYPASFYTATRADLAPQAFWQPSPAVDLRCDRLDSPRDETPHTVEHVLRYLSLRCLPAPQDVR